MSESENYVFDGFRLRIYRPDDGPAETQLYFEGRAQILTPQESKTLRLLIEKKGGFIETKTLASEVCGVHQADENIIHVAVRGLRRIFRDSARGGEYIQNVRNKGYRFAKNVSKVLDEDLDKEVAAQAEGKAEIVRLVEAEPVVQALDEERKTVSSKAANFAAKNSKDDVITFRELWRAADSAIRWIICIGVIATVALTILGLILQWPKIKLVVSLPQLFMVLGAVAYVPAGPTGLYSIREKIDDDSQYIAEKALGRYTIYWRIIWATWACLYFFLAVGFFRLGYRYWEHFVNIFTTLFNNLNTVVLILCYNILNQSVELKPGKRDISDAPWIWTGIACVVAYFVIEMLTFGLVSTERSEVPLYGLSLVSGIAGGIGMALYVGRLQSKFLGPSPWLVIALYSYMAIQSLFIFLVGFPKGRQLFAEPTETLIAVILINIALILKCLLYLYMARLFQSGDLLFYFVKVRDTYLNVDEERREFRKLLKEAR